jgi:hypothetical protein
MREVYHAGLRRLATSLGKVNAAQQHESVGPQPKLTPRDGEEKELRALRPFRIARRPKTL